MTSSEQISSLEQLQGELERKAVKLQSEKSDIIKQLKELEPQTVSALQKQIDAGHGIPEVIQQIMGAVYQQLENYQQQRIEEIYKFKVPLLYQPDLNAVDWLSHSFNEDELARQITYGCESFIDANQYGLYESIELPLVKPLLATERSYAVFDNEYQIDKQQGLNVLHERVMRLVAMMPHSSRFTLLDLDGFGSNFIYKNDLPKTRPVSDDVHKTLDDIAADIKRIYGLFSVQVQSLLDFDEGSRGNEDFEFIMVANFPRGFDRRSIEQLARIAENGPKCGKYVFLHIDEEAEFPSGTSLSMFKNLEYLPWRTLKEGEAGEGFFPVESTTMQAIFKGIQNSEKQETELRFEEGTPFINDFEQWWQADPVAQIHTPVGGSGGKKNDLRIWFGEGKDSVCAHGMLGATTGAGKSNLYHTFIMGLACRYSPDDLQFYLVDGKQGVEFTDYRSLPHCRVVSLYTSPQLARSVLEELVDTMERRNELFTQYGVSSFAEYRKAGQPGGNLARIVAVVDEYQTFFEDDRDGLGSELMLKLVSQSRSAGIHLFVGSQRFNVAGMQKQQAIFGNMHLRVGMKMTAADITALNEFQAGGKALLRSCQEVGQAVINDALGDDSSNIQGRIFRMTDDLRKELIERLQQKWHDSYADRELESPVILNGTEQPKLSENPQLLHVLHHYAERPDDNQWREFAALPQHAAGLGINEWYPVEKPHVFWLGQQQNIHGQSALILRRRQAENLVIVGDNAEARLGLSGMMLAQLPVNHGHCDAKAYLYDCAIEGSPWHGVLQQVAESTSIETNVATHSDEFAAQLNELTEELSQRQAVASSDRHQLSSIYLFISEAQRAEALQMSEGRFGTPTPSEQGQLLEQLYSKGPELGIHVVLAVDSYRALSQLMERAMLSKFRHRIALQMNEEDSFKFINGRQASRLQAAGPKPIYALYIEEMQNRMEQFKPYAYQSQEKLTEELEQLSQERQRWEA
ncbi:FtsK/SpoIIIE domain-containing protein [Idiomarina ramblicola]|uniref:FtsK domain-containing protein n=1 Tax=Idiomarina ramblicola TaxID=263724 RepID=A0A432Z1Q7_9GAMM|nr:FtsK/SpoIIIE domain-containing protein [Idiomarina ramblicola]RUO71773.1 hypothetical protein CWI78_04455 [Idiomarina ramblicola]